MTAHQPQHDATSEPFAWPPTIGVEEEFLLVDPSNGSPVAKNEAVAAVAADRKVTLQLELTRCQVETATPIVSTADELRQELSGLRHTVAAAAAQEGTRLLAVGLPPAASQEFPVTDTSRYRRIAERFGILAHEQGICGAHVHVAVPDRAAAVQVSNHLRPWLPTLLALTANSAVYRETDTGYASWRCILWRRWPSAGPPPYFDSITDYEAMVAMMRASGTVLDDVMVYWDVRPSANFPTVEVRVSDVPATVAETVLLATLVRAAVMTGLECIRHGVDAPRVSAEALRAAYWKSAHDGLVGDGIDLLDGRPIPAWDLIDKLVAQVRPALEELGEHDTVLAAIACLRTRGNGAIRQIRALGRRGNVADVLSEIALATQQ